jgi:hypothetical protein
MILPDGRSKLRCSNYSGPFHQSPIQAKSVEKIFLRTTLSVVRFFVAVLSPTAEVQSEYECRRNRA